MINFEVLEVHGKYRNRIGNTQSIESIRNLLDVWNEIIYLIYKWQRAFNHISNEGNEPKKHRTDGIDLKYK